MHIVVETGRPYCEARMTVIAAIERVRRRANCKREDVDEPAPSSIENPREGEWSVMRFPSTAMMLYPSVLSIRVSIRALLVKGY